MSKIQVSTVAEILKKNQAAPEFLRRVIEEMNLAVQPDPGDEADAEPKVKKQFVVLVSDPLGNIPRVDLTAWVFQIPEGDTPGSLKDRIFNGTADFNKSRKGKLFPAKTLGEAVENVPAKYFKHYGLSVKTKTPVWTFVTDNRILRE